MLRDLLTRLQTVVVRHPGRVALGSVVLMLLGLIAGLQVEFHTSRSELAPADDPDQIRMNELLAENAGTEALIACVEGIDGAVPSTGELQRFVDRLAMEFAADTRVEHVFHRIDLDWFLERGLYLLPTETLRQVVAGVGSRQELLRALIEVTDLAMLDDLIATQIDQGRAAGSLSGVDQDQAAGALAGLARLLEAQQTFLDDPAGAVEAVENVSPLLAFAGERASMLPANGYLATNDRNTYFVVIIPKDTSDDLDVRRDMVSAMRERAATVQRLVEGFHVAFTGQPAVVVEEMDTVRRDTWTTSAIAVIGVTLLTLLVFRWRTHAFLVLGALAIGIVLSFGAVLFEFGYLNMITSSFISTLIGIGVAYGIHPVSEYELEGAHTGDLETRILTAFRRTGAGVTVAAVTTSAAFLSIQLMRFRGFAELGVVAGIGVLFCLLVAVVTLPAFLTLYGRWRRQRVAGGHRRASVVDRVWVEMAAGRVCSRPRTVMVVAVIVTAVAAWGASGLSFSTNILQLLPRNAESVRYQNRMMMESDLAPFYNIVVAKDVEGLHAMAERAAQEASISRFESPLDFLPPDAASAQQLIETLRPLVEPLSLPEHSTTLTRERLTAALERLEEALAWSTEDAFVAGLVEIVGPLERARAAAASCLATASAADDATVDAWNAAQPRLLDVARRVVEQLRRNLDSSPPTPDNLPRELRQRFFTRSGDMLAFLHPAGEVFDRAELEEFVAASRRVDAAATGFPLVFHKMSNRITSGFYRAVALGAVLVTLILLIDFRSVRDTALALLPLGMGMVWMMGAMRLFDISFNFANLVAVPLIIGVGIDNGVHVIHRIRLEGRQGMNVVLRHTGRAILIASLTTMIGFGSLALASHRGMASLGVVLFLGVGSCLITSTVVLPNLLVTLGLVER